MMAMKNQVKRTCRQGPKAFDTHSEIIFMIRNGQSAEERSHIFILWMIFLIASCIYPVTTLSVGGSTHLIELVLSRGSGFFWWYSTVLSGFQPSLFLTLPGDTEVRRAMSNHEL
jgi:hypothetical protein